MAIKKNEKRLELDGAVEAVLTGQALTPGTLTPALSRNAGEGEKRDPVFGALDRVRRARNMTPGQRRKAEKDLKRNRVMLDLPVELEEVLDQLADRLSVPKSQAAAWLMLRGLEHAKIEEMVDAREPSRSMRYEFNLVEFPALAETWKNIR